MPPPGVRTVRSPARRACPGAAGVEKLALALGVQPVRQVYGARRDLRTGPGKQLGVHGSHPRARRRMDAGNPLSCASDSLDPDDRPYDDPLGRVAAGPLPRGLPRPAPCVGRRRRVSAAASRGERPAALSGSVVVVGDRWGALTTALVGAPADADHRLVPRPGGDARESGAHRRRRGSAVRLLTTQDTSGRAHRRAAGPGAEEPRAPGGPAAPAGARVHEGTVVIGTGMVKEIHTSTLKLFERILGPTRTSLAEKKARLIFCTPYPGDRPDRPTRGRTATTLPDGIGPVSGRTVVNHAGVFCADRLDIGTRFFLQHLPRSAGAERVVDLGCGNGVVGTAMALAQPRGRGAVRGRVVPGGGLGGGDVRGEHRRRARQGGVPRRRRAGGHPTRQRRPRAEQSAVPLAPGDDGRHGLADVHRGAPCAAAGRRAVGDRQPPPRLSREAAPSLRQQ